MQSVYRVLLTVDRVLAKYSPVILLQRHIRGWLVRKALAKSTNQKIRYSSLESKEYVLNYGSPHYQVKCYLIIYSKH